MTQLQVLLHDWTAQIEVAIFEADVFIHVGVVDEAYGGVLRRCR